MKQVKLFFGMMLFAFVAVACSGSNSNSPEGVAQEFLEVFAKGDSKRLIEIIYMSEDDNTPEARAMIAGKLEMMVAAGKQEMDSKGGIKKIEVNEVNFNSDKTKASVFLTVTYKDGEVSGPDEVGTVKTKDGWKVEL